MSTNTPIVDRVPEVIPGLDFNNPETSVMPDGWDQSEGGPGSFENALSLSPEAENLLDMQELRNLEEDLQMAHVDVIESEQLLQKQMARIESITESIESKQFSMDA